MPTPTCRRGLAHRPPGLRHPGGRTPRGGSPRPRPLAAAPRVACARPAPRQTLTSPPFPAPTGSRPPRRALTSAPNEASRLRRPPRPPRTAHLLAGYLARAPRRPHRPRPHVICAGFHHGLMLLGDVLCRRGVRNVAVGRDGLDASWDVLTRTGLRTRPLPFDELGTDPGALDDWGPARGARWGSRVGRRAGGGRAAGVGAALLTPAHQFPMGVPLHPDRRAAAVDWAPHGRPDPGGRLRRRVLLRPPTRRRTAGPRPRPVVYLGTASSPSPPAYASGGWSCPPP